MQQDWLNEFIVSAMKVGLRVETREICSRY